MTIPVILPKTLSNPVWLKKMGHSEVWLKTGKTAWLVSVCMGFVLKNGIFQLTTAELIESILSEVWDCLFVVTTTTEV